MSWKHYAAGALSGLGLAGIIYYATNSGDYRREKTLCSFEMSDDLTINIRQTDLKFADDEYRIEIIDKNGVVKFQSKPFRF